MQDYLRDLGPELLHSLSGLMPDLISPCILKVNLATITRLTSKPSAIVPSLAGG